jgi:hypothetical protein
MVLTVARVRDAHHVRARIEKAGADFAKLLAFPLLIRLAVE